MTLSNWSITLLEGITIFALLFGPISSVCVGMRLEKRRDAHNRKWEIFRILMRDRSHIPDLTPDYVGALNLIAAEFHNKKIIIDALTELNNHIRQGSEFKPKPISYLEKIIDLNRTLIAEIAKSLNVKLDKLEIYKGSYLLSK